MTSRAGRGDLTAGLLNVYRPSVAMIALGQGSIGWAGIHVTIRAGHTRHSLLVRHAHATGTGEDVVAEVISIGKPKVAMTLATELGRVGHGLILCSGGIEIGW